jgi:hypothetical protein
VGAVLNWHGVSRVIVFVNCELKLRDRQFLGRLINFSRKTSHHEVGYFKEIIIYANVAVSFVNFAELFKNVCHCLSCLFTEITDILAILTSSNGYLVRKMAPCVQ